MARFDLSPLGWRRDLPDPRDYSPRHDTVRDLFASLKRGGGGRARTGRRARELPGQVDLREFCPHVDDLRPLNACSAEACVSLLQTCERRASGRMLDLSTLFVYQNTLRMQQAQDSGADLRGTLRALVRCGAPPAEYWPNDLARLDLAPDAFLYSFARDFADLTYLRLDAEGAGSQTLRTVREFLAAGFASVCGFSVPNSLGDEADIPFPTHFDAIVGGQAVTVVGYDDDRRIRSTKGALLVRGGWGPTWGDGGYGWLPYRYVEDRLAVDFWTLTRPSWIASGEFDEPL